MRPFILDEHLRNTLYSWREMAMILLYESYYEKLLRIADMHTHDRQASQDVLQDVFVDIWQRHKVIGQMRDESLQSFLVKAVQYSAIRYYQNRSKRAKVEKEYFYSNADTCQESPAEAPMIASEKQDLIRLIIATFPAREKQCLLLQIDHEMPVKEIATRLGVSKKAVERSLTSARKRLKRFSGLV